MLTVLSIVPRTLSTLQTTCRCGKLLVPVLICKNYRLIPFIYVCTHLYICCFCNLCRLTFKHCYKSRIKMALRLGYNWKRVCEYCNDNEDRGWRNIVYTNFFLWFNVRKGVCAICNSNVRVFYLLIWCFMWVKHSMVQNLL